MWFKFSLIEVQIPNKSNTDEWIPLQIAAFRGYIDVVQLLLDGEADSNKETKKGETPLHDAARKGRRITIQILLDRGADPNKSNTDE